jgi:hypothetical protein
MSENNKKHKSSQAQQAMNRALQAEQDAVATISQCKDQVTDILNQAQLTAQHIRQRTDQRISRINDYCTRTANKKIQLLRQQQSERESREEDSIYDEGILAIVVDKLSRRIIGVKDND